MESHGIFVFTYCMNPVIVLGLALILSTSTLALSAVRASRVLHADLLDNILHWSLLTFEQTPIGRILNRFADDLMDIDLVFHFTIRSMINTILGFIATLVVMATATPLILAVIPPLSVIYIIIQVFVT